MGVVQIQGVITGIVAAKSGVTLLARILGADGAPITPSTISTIQWTVTNLGTIASPDSTQVATGTFAVASSLYSQPQAGAPWTRDDATNPGQDGRYGYNFRAPLPASAIPQAGANRLRVDVKFTPVSGEAFFVQFEFSPNRTYGS